MGKTAAERGPALVLASPTSARHTVRGMTRAFLWPISTVLHYLHALLTSVLLAVLALGPMPHHVGFVMDGNRRYARSHGQRIAKGHQQGSESLKRVSWSWSWSCAWAGG
jgi:ditrans,polycis-polyprenyl diphosphate synthase